MTNSRVCVLILLCVGVAAFGQPLYVIQSGHTGPVNAMRFQSGTNRLVTAGADGLVKVWDIQKLDAVYSQSVAPRNIQLLSVHPDKTIYAAVFEEEGEYFLVVRDWSRNEELFRLSFTDKPLMMEFSPRGTYLSVCLENWRSLYLYKATDGRELGVFSNGFGIVSYVAFSTKETTLMTYQPSGKITYWETGTGRKMSEFKTLAGLLPVCLSSSKVYLICSRKNEIIFLDVVTGKTASRLELPGMILITGDGSGERVAVFSSRRGERETVSLFTIGNGGLQELFKNALADSNAFTSLVANDHSVFAGNNRGEVFLLYKNNNAKIIENNLLFISDMAVRGTSLTLGSLRRLFAFASDFFVSGRAGSKEPTALSFRSVVQPYPGSPIGLAFDDDQALAVWEKNGSPAGLSLLDGQSLTVKKRLTPFTSPPVTGTIDDGMLLSIEQDGSCVIVDARDGTARFTYRSAGVNTAVFVPPALIICGKSRLSSYESSLALIKVDTGETTFLQETADIVYQLAFDRASGTLYYIGMEKKNGRMYTVVKYRTGRELKHEKTIFTKPGRFYNSVLSLNSENNKLYFSLEENVVYSWDGTTVRTLESSPRPVRKLYSFPGMVYALNSDSSVTAWDPLDGRIMFNLFLFTNLSWLLLTRDGYYFSQGNVAPFVRVYDQGPEPKNIPENYRLNLTLSMNVKDSP